MYSAAAVTHRAELALVAPETGPAAWRPLEFERYRSMLVSHARRSLRNHADAEDAVQETLAAALAARGFAGRSTLGTWLYGILEHKIVDIYRRRAREPVLERAPDDELRDDVDAMFTPDGQWRETPAALGDPEAALDRREFHAVLEACLACLPARCARAFRLREMMGLEVDEVCAALGVTRENCYVMLHRARMKLRALLQERWLATAKAAHGAAGGRRTGRAQPAAAAPTSANL